jgi:hypothetical protein
LVESVRHVEEERGNPFLFVSVEMKQLVSRTDEEHQIANRIDLAHTMSFSR